MDAIQNIQNECRHRFGEDVVNGVRVKSTTCAICGAHAPVKTPEEILGKMVGGDTCWAIWVGDKYVDCSPSPEESIALMSKRMGWNGARAEKFMMEQNWFVVRVVNYGQVRSVLVPYNPDRSTK